MPDAEHAAGTTVLSLRQQHRGMVPCRDSVGKGFQVLTRSLWYLHVPYPLVIPFTGHLRPLSCSPAGHCPCQLLWAEALLVRRFTHCEVHPRGKANSVRQPLPPVMMLLHRDCVMLALGQPKLQERWKWIKYGRCLCWTVRGNHLWGAEYSSLRWWPQLAVLACCAPCDTTAARPSSDYDG